MTRQLAVFLAVGVLNTVFGYSVFSITYLAGASPHLALLASAVSGCVWNFFTVGIFVFGSAQLSRLPRFAAMGAGVYLLNSALLTVLIGNGVPPLVAEFMALGGTVPATFLVSKYVVFPRQQETPRRRLKRSC